ncbi:MAG TPA: DsrE/DsrF/DrsH-like family protein, partial [Gammaproteobacteria bacterium]|nr:DsrE/DsrF/DrsH-like family protein [Gammaproteobacteria bacterium]
MSTSPENLQQADPQMDAWLNQKLDELLPTKLKEIDAARTPSMAIIATKGTLDWAYPPFILASTASAIGWDSAIFFTFYGLLLLK